MEQTKLMEGGASVGWPPKAHWDFRDRSTLAGWIENGADFLCGVANRI